MTTSTADRLRISKNPFRLFASPAPWAALGYTFSYIVISGVLFAVALAALIISSVLSIFWIGIPLLIGAALVVRGLAEFERIRLGLTQRGVESSTYAKVTRPGLINQLKTRWSDPATWRNVLYFTLAWPFLLAINVVAFTVWVAFAGMMSFAFWYWSIPTDFPNGEKAHGIVLGYFPNGPHHPPRGPGLFVHNIPTALLAGGIGLVLLVFVGNYLIAGVARLHASIARSLIGMGGDPLIEARQVLANPGPLARATSDPLFEAKEILAKPGPLAAAMQETEISTRSDESRHGTP